MRSRLVRAAKRAVVLAALLHFSAAGCSLQSGFIGEPADGGAACGNGVVDPGETCDDGNGVDTDDCRNDCTSPNCGNGVVDTGEACDDGNTVDTDACLSICVAARCGDGVIQAGVEACDDGNTVDTDACSNACVPSTCGDGMLQAGEECDDGNTSPLDGCSVGCLFELGLSPETPGLTCLDIRQTGGFSASGVYWIDPDGPPITDELQVWCDMVTDGGGWTLVLLNNQAVTPGPDPTLAAALSVVSTTGTFGADLSAFDLFMGLQYWPVLGSQLRIEVGPAPGMVVKQAIYEFTIDPSNDWSIALSGGPGLLIGSPEPGVKTYSSTLALGLTTSDNDVDTWPTNCHDLFGYAWWYGGCWDGSFWGSRNGGVFADAAYWAGTSTDYHAYGAFWIR